MKNFFAAVLIVLSLVTLSACSKEEAPEPGNNKVEIEKQRERADREQKAREEERRGRIAAEERADFWKTMVWVVVITGGIFTLVGIAIGSSARKKAEKVRANE